MDTLKKEMERSIGKTHREVLENKQNFKIELKN